MQAPGWIRRRFQRKDGKVHGRGCLTAILIGSAITGCSSDVSKAPESGRQFSVGDTGAMRNGRPHPGYSQGGFGGGFGGDRGPVSTEYDGEIDGDYVLQQSGSRIDRYGGKGATPLIIKIKSENLPLMPLTDEVGEQLLKLSGSRVRLWGWMRRAHSMGRGTLGGQQGDSQAIPDHVVRFLVVDTVEAI